MNGYMGHVTAVPADDFIVASPMHGTSAASGALILASLAMTDSNSHVLSN
jgi:hypothetical protein